MSYQSLARKYRPQRFKDMVGQDAVTAALANAIKLGREPQGVVFSGVRGVGKTTAARLYAKALNCENGPVEDPCNACNSCLAVNDGNHEDVLEIDGASNTGVEDIRALQETLDYVPQRSKFKIYIIDEVHMLSQSAFNALLKTLEEPPSHVVFVFATTELHKVPETILSRCQVFHLKNLSTVATTQRIKSILMSEDIEFEEHALATIAKEGRGSMRDALTFLDQVIALGGGRITAEVVNSLVNAASSQTFIDFLDGLIAKDQEKILKLIDGWDQGGITLTTAIEDIAKLSRHGFVLKELGRDAMDLALLGLAPAEQDQLLEVSARAELLDLNRIFRVLVKCRKDLDGSELDRFIVENCALEWCLDPGLPSIEDLTELLSGGVPTQRTSPVAMAMPTPPAMDLSKKASTSKLTDKWKANFGTNLAESSDAREEVKGISNDNHQAAAVAPLLGDSQKIEPSPLPSKELKENIEDVQKASITNHHQNMVIEPKPAPLIHENNGGMAKERDENSSNFNSSSAGRPITPRNQNDSQSAKLSPEPVQTLSGKVTAISTEASEPVPSNNRMSFEAVKPNASVPVKKQAEIPNSRFAPDDYSSSHLEPVFDDDDLDLISKPVKNDSQSVVLASQSLQEDEEIKSLPNSWKEIVEVWKKTKPLQGRMLEETVPIAFNALQIRIAVDPKSMGGGKLLHPDNKNKVCEGLFELFGFKGQLIVETIGEAQSDEALEGGESLLNTRMKEREIQREKKRSDLQNHPLTIAAVSAFDGTIKSIELQEF